VGGGVAKLSVQSASPLPRGRRILFTAAMGVILAVALELIARGGLAVIEDVSGRQYRPLRTNLSKAHRRILTNLFVHETRPTSMIFDAELGWTRRPDYVGGAGVFNSQGIRADHDYAPEAHPGTLRVVAVGDSFTAGAGMTNDETWESRLEVARPGLEVLNFGVGAYGPDQALLRYRREARAFSGDVALLGFMSENLSRTINTFRPFYSPETGMPLAKPRLSWNGSALTLVPNPLPTREDYLRLLREPRKVLRELGRNDWFYQHRFKRSALDGIKLVRLATVAAQILREGDSQVGLYRNGVYRTDTAAFVDTAAILEAFHREASADGAIPAIVLFPLRKDVERAHAGEPAAYAPLRALLEEHGLNVIDTLPALVEDLPASRARELYQKDGHLSVEGNRCVALAVGRWLESRGLP